MLRAAVGTVGAWFIYGLIWLFGTRRDPRDVAWLAGPLGGPYIGDRAYEETATAEGLTLVRDAYGNPSTNPNDIDRRDWYSIVMDP